MTRRPTFLMVGAQRCGTTWVDAALREHPQIYLPAKKQTYFFDRHYDRGIEWYLAHFDQADPAQHKAVGEVATGYCLLDAVPRMVQHLPDVKLMMAMRSPLDRALSQYHVRRSEQGWNSFEHALEVSPDLLARGRYIEQIEAIVEHYPRERLLLLFFDDLSRDDRQYLRTILKFLEVDPHFESSQFGKQRNSAMFPRLRRTMTRLGMRPLLGAMSRSRVGDIVRRIKRRSGRAGYSAMRSETRLRLIEYYAPFNERLAALTGRDLSHWNA